jgi:nucleoside 2-deoxyribosyltransferase
MVFRGAVKQKPIIYFAGSIRGGRQDQDLYLRLIQYLARFGEVLTEHIGDSKLTADGEFEESDKEIFERDSAWIRAADAFVAEVTTPSLGVGYEIGRAEELQKPVLCLFRNLPRKRLSAMIAGNERLVIQTYRNWEDLIQRIDAFFLSLGIRKSG